MEAAIDTDLLVNDLVLPGMKTVSGRGALTVANSVDWDSSATFYQATTIAHGHLLHLQAGVEGGRLQPG